MRILFVADARSPIARNWLRYWKPAGHQVFVASTFAAEPDASWDGFAVAPVAFSGAARVGKGGARRPAPGGARMIRLRAALRHWAGPLTLSAAADRLEALIRQWKPDLVHALRIPFEGMLAAEALRALDIPLLLSAWGNDFTLHAPASPLMAWATRRALRRANALHADCARDVRLAANLGWNAGLPSIVLPGNGGLDLDVFHPPQTPVNEPVVINPRGFRAYVRNDTFFRAIPLVLDRRPDVRFLCAAMAGEPAALEWLARLNIHHVVTLLPHMPREQLANVFRTAQVTVSPSTHDGTPNSLLESMACGCVPVAGDLDSIREWIEDGHNGLLVDPSSPQALADAILQALERHEWRRQAQVQNWQMLQDRAAYDRCMPQAEDFYQRVLASCS